VTGLDGPVVSTEGRSHVRRTAEKAGPILRFCVIVLFPLTNLFWRKTWFHLERIPKQGPAIIAMNHISYADPIVVGRAIWDAGRCPRFLAKASLFKSRALGWIFRGTSQIPVYRGTNDASEAVRGAVEALQGGGIVLFYPEGTVTRSPDFWPMEAKTGIGRLVLLAPDVPVIPMGQWGAQHWLDFYARKFRPFPRTKVSVSVGAPLELSKYAGAEPTPETLRELTDVIMQAVQYEVAVLRGETPPRAFYKRPAGVGARKKDAA